MPLPTTGVRGPLGPGDADPTQQTRGAAAPVCGPLAPGDSAPDAPVPVAADVVTPLGPGDRVDPGPPAPAISTPLKTKYDKPTSGV